MTAATASTTTTPPALRTVLTIAGLTLREAFGACASRRLRCSDGLMP